MNSSIPYNKLEISGALLIPSFSIYLLEILYKEERLFYIGMTGDNFYPSARAAFHRISGHLELTKQSTQNQLHLALEGLEIEKDKLNEVNLTMHHFPIIGFEEWTLTKSKKHDEIKKKEKTEEYKKFKKRRAEVYEFENALIYKLREQLNDKLLNKTVSKKSNIAEEFVPIFEEIEKIIFSPLNTEGYERVERM